MPQIKDYFTFEQLLLQLFPYRYAEKRFTIDPAELFGTTIYFHGTEPYDPRYDVMGDPLPARHFDPDDVVVKIERDHAIYDYAPSGLMEEIKYYDVNKKMFSSGYIEHYLPSSLPFFKRYANRPFRVFGKTLWISTGLGDAVKLIGREISFVADKWMELATYVLGPQFLLMTVVGFWNLGNWIALSSEQSNFNVVYSYKTRRIANVNKFWQSKLSPLSALYGLRGPLRDFADGNIASADMFILSSYERWKRDYMKDITGDLIIMSTPKDANITINDWQSGKLTPHVFMKLKPGDHKVILKRHDRLKRRLYEVEREVVIYPGQTEVLRVDFSEEVIEYPDEGVVSEVIDGDTIRLYTGEKIRYIGMNTPEKNTYFYKEAKARNEELILGRKVRLEYDRDKKDKYNRVLAYVFADGKFINKALIDEGMARFHAKSPNYLHASKFYKSESEAKEKRIGLWSKLAPETATLRILSDPSDAEIVIDDEPIDELTPYTVHGILPGRHKIKVVKKI